jgi:hypothetical protein
MNNMKPTPACMIGVFRPDHGMLHVKNDGAFISCIVVIKVGPLQEVYGQ